MQAYLGIENDDFGYTPARVLGEDVKEGGPVDYDAVGLQAGTAGRDLAWVACMALDHHRVRALRYFATAEEHAHLVQSFVLRRVRDRVGEVPILVETNVHLQPSPARLDERFSIDSAG